MKKTTPNYDWINTPPTEEELDSNADGSQFIPIFFVEKKLTRLDPYWGTENFKFQLLRGASGCMFADGSLEIVITYGGRTRRLVGAATILIPAETNFEDPAVNSNYGASVKSECIKNGSKACGISFGQQLNDRDFISTPTNKQPYVNGKKKPDPVEMLPDKKIQDQYNKYVEDCNDRMIKVLKIAYPSIQYNGIYKNQTDVKS